MGYGFYLLADGREAGYGVEATCDFKGCDAKIDRGFAYLCGRWPATESRTPEGGGCRQYFCMDHLDEWRHDCPQPQCSDVNGECEDVGTIKVSRGTWVCEEHLAEWTREMT